MNAEEVAPECKLCRHEAEPEDRPPCSLCRQGRFWEEKPRTAKLNDYPAGMVAIAGMFVGIIIGGIGGLLVGMVL